MSIVFWPLFTPYYTYSLLCYKIKHLLHIHHLHNIKKRSPRRFSPGRRPHRFLQRDHCICSLFRNGNGFSVSIPTTGTGLRSLFRPYKYLYLYFKYTSYPSNSQRTFSSLHKDILYFIICIAIEKEPDYSLPTLLPTQINKALKTQRFQGFLAGDERIELPPKVLETPIIPFDQSPIWENNVDKVRC